MANVRISNLSTVWTSSLNEYDGIKMTVTDVASSGSSKLIDLQVGSASKFSVRKDSVVTAGAFVGGFTGSLVGSASFSVSSSNSQYTLTSSHALQGISSSFSERSNQSVSSSFNVTSSFSVSSSFSTLAQSAVSTTSASFSEVSQFSEYSSTSGHSSTSNSSSYTSTAANSLTAVSASFGSLSNTSSHAVSALSASYALNGGSLATGSSHNITSSWATTASFAMSAMANLGTGSYYNITSSWSANVISSSYAASSSVAHSASYAVSSSRAVSSSHAVTASYAERYAPYWPSNVEISGSGLFPSTNNVANYVATSASFSLFASSLGNTPQYFKWHINSSSLLQAGTSSVYNVTSSRKNPNSGIYTCQVTNSYGSATSQNFQVQVLDPVVLVSETPPDSTPTVNSMVYFIVSATGDLIRYRWKKRGTTPALDAYVVDGVPSILNEGYASSTLTIQAISPESEGSYFCEISNSVSSTSSSNMLIYVTAPTIVTQPGDLDTNGLSSVVATGSAISYSWHYNGIPITEQYSATLNLSTAVNDGYFTQAMMDQLSTLKCKVYNGVGYNFSNTIQVKPFKKSGEALSGHTGTATRAEHNVIAITAASQIVAPTGTTYAVYKSGTNVGSDTTALGESMPKLTLHNVQSSDAGSYVVSASFNGKHVVSDVATLTISANGIYHNSLPITRYVFGDETHVLVADYGYCLGDAFNNNQGLAYPGVYLISRALRKTGVYTALDRSDQGASVSCPNAAILTTGLSYPTSTVTMTGTNIGASGTTGSTSTTVYYQIGLSSTLSTCPTNSLSTPDPWAYLHPDTLESTNTAENVSISGLGVHTAGIISYGSLAITTHPSGSQTKATGSAVTFRTVATCGAAAIHYRWYRNGTRIPDSDSSIYSISSVATTDSGSYYCIVGAKSTLTYRTMQSSASMLVVS